MTAAPSFGSHPQTRPSSRDNAAIVRAEYAALSGLAQGGEIASDVAAPFDSDCEYPAVEEASTIHRHVALIRWVERWLEAWDDAWDEVDELIEAGRMVVAAIRVHGRGRLSGMEISRRLFDVFELRDDRVLRSGSVSDPAQALEAAGLRGYAATV